MLGFLAGLYLSIVPPKINFDLLELHSQKVRCTCYIPTGNKTADGTVPYEGIIASNSDHLGDCALLYTLDGEYIGLFECRDTGGNAKLRNGTAIDVFRDNLDRVYEWVGNYGDYVMIIWIESEG